MPELEQPEYILDLVNDSVMTRTLEGRINFWNHSAEELYGWRKEEAIGRVSHDLLQTEFPKPLREIESELVRNGRWEGKLVHTTRDGDRVTVESRWTLELESQLEALVEINTRSNDPEARTNADSVEIGRDGVSLVGIVPKLAAIRFRLYLALYKSELVRSLRHISEMGKNLIRVAITNPRQIVPKILGKLRHANGIETQEPQLPKAPIKITPSPKSSLPIIFIHKSNSDHLKYSLAQAQRSNPSSTIFLLGDSSNDAYEFVEHRSMFDYFIGAAQFKKIYKHFSTNSADFEIICFQRWFILREFLMANNLQRCLYLDSDTMLYTDVTADSRKFEHYDFTLSQMTSGCTFFLNRVEALSDFCNFVLDMYTLKDRYHYDKMVAHFTARKMNRLPGGVCDMTAFQLYNELRFGEIGEAAQLIDGSVYDPAITSPAPGFEMENGIKKITWRQGIPYGKHVRTGREIKFNSLQFQGRTKHLMSQCYTGYLD